MGDNKRHESGWERRRRIRREIVRYNTPLSDKVKDWLFKWFLIGLCIFLFVLAVWGAK